MSSGKKKCKVCKSWHEQGACAKDVDDVYNNTKFEAVKIAARKQAEGRIFLDISEQAMEDHADTLARLADRKTVSHVEAWAEVKYPKKGATKRLRELRERQRAETLAKAELAAKSLSEGTKHDAGKPDLTLLPQEALHSIARAFEYGARKYTRGNYKKGMAYSRVLAAAFRHGFAYASGEKLDSESGLSHLAHMGACVCMLLFYEVSGRGTNDLEDQT